MPLSAVSEPWTGSKLYQYTAQYGTSTVHWWMALLQHDEEDLKSTPRVFLCGVCRFSLCHSPVSSHIPKTMHVLAHRRLSIAFRCESLSECASCNGHVTCPGCII